MGLLKSWEPVRIFPENSIRGALEVIGRGMAGIALVADSQGRLLGTVVDGDVRRAVLKGRDLKTPVSEIMTTTPVVGRVQESPAVLLDRMLSSHVHQLPILTGEGLLAGLVTLEDLVARPRSRGRALIMAGGPGERLRPLTEDMPKSLLPVGDRPVMEILLEKLRQSGVHEVLVATHYRAEQIEEQFGDGTALGMDIRYLREDTRNGTIGALREVRGAFHEPFLVINSDILTDVNLAALRVFHDQNRADMTVAVRRYDMRVPFGVVELEGERVVGIVEKPEVPMFINAGIYLVNPDVIAYVPAEGSFDATDLIAALTRAGRRVCAFPVLEYWIDIGQHADYEKARLDAEDGRVRLH